VLALQAQLLDNLITHNLLKWIRAPVSKHERIINTKVMLHLMLRQTARAAFTPRNAACACVAACAPSNTL
jgi:hypothetical protein